MAKDLGRLLTAMLTPFAPDGAVDYQSAEKLAALLAVQIAEHALEMGVI